MKRLVVAICLLVIMVVFSGITLYHLYDTQNLLLSKLDTLSDTVENGDQAQSATLAQEFTDLWMKKEETLTRYVRHARIDSISTSAVQLPALPKYDDPSLLMSHIAILQNEIYHLWISEIPSLPNLL